ANSGPFGGIAAGPDGNVWFTEENVGKIGKINPSTGAITEYPIATPGSNPDGIAAGPDGNMWFTEEGHNAIGRITPSGEITEFPLPLPSGGTPATPSEIAAGPDGNMWFTETARGEIGQIAPRSSPSAAIASPAAGGSFALGQSVASSFSCSEGEGGPGLASCDDSDGTATIAGGSGRLDTSTLGSHTYTVTATSKDGLTGSASIAYTVIPASVSSSTAAGGSTHPAVSIKSSRATVVGGRLKLTLACAAGSGASGCRGTLSLTLAERIVRRVHRHRRVTEKTIVLTRARYRLAAGHSQSIALRLTGAGTGALVHAPRHGLSVLAVATASGGRPAKRTVILAYQVHRRR
ncbi:MAG: virginiamycin B lyase family protein, partial [Solirubrobacteraceae bacterium]